MENKKSKGISPVIATIIMVAVAIVVSIAAALWLAGLMGTFTAYEAIQIRMINVVKETSGWNFTITITNIGTGSAAIEKVYIDTHDCTSKFNFTTPYTLPPGHTILILMDNASDFFNVHNYKSGRTVTVKIVTAAGNEYYRTVVLP